MPPTDRNQLHCPSCGAPIPDSDVQSRAASLASQARLKPAGGRPALVAPCPDCGERLSARQRRAHRCPGKPAPRIGRPPKPLQTLEI